MRRTLFGGLAIGSAVVAVGFISVPTILHAESGQAFSISPPLIELKADPGQTVTASIKLTNISQSPLVMQAQANDFAAKDETGDPNIIFENSETDLSLIHNWVSLPQAFTMASKEVRMINFPINVPKDAEPGGHYVVIRFTGSPPGLEGSGVALSASIGSLVLLRVSGTVEQRASLASFYSATTGLAETSFFETGPITFVERIKNDGNIHIKPTGIVQVTDMFGRLINNLPVNTTSADSKTSSGSILPHSVRRFTQELTKTWMFGRYTAVLSLTYGDPAQTITQTTVFWVIPYTLIGAVLLGLALLFLALRWGIKRYNQYIIKRSRRLSR